MNICPINNNQNNANFGALKSIDFARKLAKNPQAQEKLLDAIQLNSSLQNFCKKFDVNLVFDAFEDGYNRGVSRMAVIYKDLPDKSKTFFEKLKDTFKAREPIVISGYDYTLGGAIDDLTTRISSQQDGIFDYTVDKVYEEKLAKEKAEANLKAKKEKELAEKTELQRAQEKVNERIKNLLNKQ